MSIRSGTGRKMRGATMPLRGRFAEQIGGENNWPFTEIANERLARCRREVRLAVKIVLVTPLICEPKSTRERIPA